MLLGAIFGSFVAPPCASAADDAVGADAYQSLNLLFDTLERVRDYYVVPMPTEELVRLAVQGILEGLDEHSRFLSADDFSSLQASTRGTFYGVGVVVAVRGGYPTVISPIEATPAGRAGIRSGERLLAIDGVDTQGMDLEAVVRMLRGEADSVVRLRLGTPDGAVVREVALRREEIHLESVTGPVLFPDGTAYIRLSRFTEATADEMGVALDGAEKAGATAVVLDLRGNPGGLLSQAVAVAERFVAPGDVIVEVRGRAAPDCRVYRAGAGPKSDLPLALLVDRGCASAAEILAAAIQDHGRGVLVGEPTFGKGSVQSIFPTENGCALKLTTAHYFSPSGRSVERSAGADDGFVSSGIRPDFFIDPPEPDSLTLALVADGVVADFVAGHDRPLPADLSRPLARDYIESFREYAAVRRGRAALPAEQDGLDRVLREAIGLQIGGEMAALRVRLCEDPAFLEALALLRSVGHVAVATAP
jgi:carboxyl-terminal processing protease